MEGRAGQGRGSLGWRHPPQPPTGTPSCCAPGPDHPHPAALPPTWRLPSSTLPSPGFPVLSIFVPLRSHSQPRAASLLWHLSVFSLPWGRSVHSSISSNLLHSSWTLRPGIAQPRSPIVQHRWDLLTLSEMPSESTESRCWRPCPGKCRRATLQRTVTVLRCLGFHSLEEEHCQALIHSFTDLVSQVLDLVRTS